MNTYSTIIVKEQRAVLFIKLNRPAVKNSINATLINEVVSALKQSEQNEAIKVVVIEGNEQFFCTGLDFHALNDEGAGAAIGDDPNGYYNLLKCISFSSKIVIAKVEGKVNAGGIGIVAACDIVIAGEEATFGLSEALFGLLPACVLPFLIRRVGHQKAQWMTLITQGISAQRAYEIGLVDELSKNTNDSLRRNLLRQTRLETTTIANLKDYMSKLWMINDETQALAVEKITSLVKSKQVQHNIKNYIENGKFPWDK